MYKIYKKLNRLEFPYSENLHDLHSGLRRWEFAYRWAWVETAGKYRRSIIGHFWITINLAVMITGLGVVFGLLFGNPIAEFLPYVGAGMVVWGTISASIGMGAKAFLESENEIQKTNIPLILVPLKVVFSEIIILAHNLIVVLVLVVFFPVDVTWATLLSIPGIVLVYLVLFSFSIILSVISVRFIDMHLIVANGVQSLFFITPVFWNADMLGNGRWLADINPLYHLITIVREPLLGRVPPALSYMVVFGLLLVSAFAACFVYGRYRHRIAYWV